MEFAWLPQVVERGEQEVRSANEGQEPGSLQYMNVGTAAEKTVLSNAIEPPLFRTVPIDNHEVGDLPSAVALKSWLVCSVGLLLRRLGARFDEWLLQAQRRWRIAVPVCAAFGRRHGAWWSVQDAHYENASA